MTAPAVAGIDYSTKSLDVAIVSGRELVSCVSYDLGRDLACQINVTATVVEDLRLAGVRVVAMETPWAKQGHGIGAAMTLHKVPTRVEALAVLAGLEVRFVPVNTWHKTILGNGGLKSDAAKAASLRYVELVYGKRMASADAADAVCLASYGASVFSTEERINNASRI